jgi:hypothetical protein
MGSSFATWKRCSEQRLHDDAIGLPQKMQDDGVAPTVATRHYRAAVLSKAVYAAR